MLQHASLETTKINNTDIRSFSEAVHGKIEMNFFFLKNKGFQNFSGQISSKVDSVSCLPSPF